MKKLLLSITLLCSSSMLIASTSFQNKVPHRGAYHEKNFFNQSVSSVDSYGQRTNYAPMGYQRLQSVERRGNYTAPKRYQRLVPRVRPRVQRKRVPQARMEYQQRRVVPQQRRVQPHPVQRGNFQPRINQAQKYRFEQASMGAKRGNPQAEFDLAMMYAKGEGVMKNPRMAFNLFHRAARKGHVEAKFCMAVNFDKGYGVIQQKELARHWYNIAAKAGHRLARQRLAKIDAQHLNQNRGLIMNASYHR